MYTKIANEIIDDLRDSFLDEYTEMVYWAILQRVRSEFDLKFSISELSRWSGVNRRKVMGCLQKLENHGLIERDGETTVTWVEHYPEDQRVNYTMIDNTLMDDMEIPHNAKRIFSKLVRLSDYKDTGEVRIGQEALSKNVGIHRNHVAKNVAILEEKGWLKVIQVETNIGGRKTYNRYKVKRVNPAETNEVGDFSFLTAIFGGRSEVTNNEVQDIIVDEVF